MTDNLHCFHVGTDQSNEAEKKRLLHLVTLLLPKGNRDTVEVQAVDPLSAQLEHFLDVITGAAQPLVSARDGLQSLRLVLAASASAAADGAPVEVEAPPSVSAAH